jgi:hypothetical protein
MKNLYIVDYWIPFPASEGGIINVIAESKQECHDILLEWRDECYDHYDSNIMERVENAQFFPLANEEESRVVDSFTI